MGKSSGWQSLEKIEQREHRSWIHCRRYVAASDAVLVMAYFPQSATASLLRFRQPAALLSLMVYLNK